ncbi:MAG: sigma-70 family RNA polymerase sigma factor [Mycobacteriaceae bacterium]|nr:sigma-70 family RNA polymerase sigma factor [Mycobacteriaceae bacterium]MBV9641576.1 sigma-70 family RNA polymerase sigma factor [Mycobacteriaceae bacterium]
MCATGLTARFEQQRPQLKALAYRMLGTLTDAEDAVQEAWIRLHRADAEHVDNLAAWLTTVVARICLNMLRARHARRDEDLLAQLPDPIVDPVGASDPEHQALLADSVGLALFVVLETLPPPERLAFVLHDVFALPFDQIAPIVERSPVATRQLASRARRRIQAAHPTPDGDMAAQRAVVDAFFAAGRSGDFDRLVAVLHPDVELRGDFGPGRTTSARGATTVAKLAKAYAGLDNDVRAAAVNGAAGAVVLRSGRPMSIMAFLVAAGTVRAIDVLADPDRIARLDLAAVLDRT